MKTFFLVALLLLCLTHNNESEAEKLRKKRSFVSVNGVLKVGARAGPILKDIVDMWKMLLSEPEKGAIGALTRNKEHDILGGLITISSKLQSLDIKIRGIGDATSDTILATFPHVMKLEFRLYELRSILTQINFAHEQLRSYLIHGYKNSTPEVIEEFETATTDESTLSPKTEPCMGCMYRYGNSVQKREAGDGWLIEMFTLQEFAAWATSHNHNSIMALLSRMNNLLISDDNTGPGLFDLIGKVSEELRTYVCNLRQSPHQILYNLYNTVALADLKGNTILQFSYMLLKMYNKGNFTVEAKLAQTKYEERAKQKIEVAREALAVADRSIYRCDPKQHVEGVTYTKLTKLLQGYIENEVNLNPHGTCRENCQYYKYTEYNTCFKNKFCAHQPQCRGKVVECRYVDSDMNICTSTRPERRYDWIEYENGRVLGNKGVCQSKNFYKVDSWWRYLFWHCSYCLCLCDDNDRSSDRYFNLREVTSDIRNNMVVTGVRLLKHNQIIHMQIQQGMLTPRALVDKSTLAWKPVDNYTIDDNDVENNVDYHTMNWLDRAIDTDEVFAPSEHAVTGVRFRKLGSHLNLEVRVTPINFTTGEVFNENYSYWMGNDNTDASLGNPRLEIQLDNPDIPLRHGPHTLDSEHDQFIQFQQTSFDSDAGQSTVPYIDSQVLTSHGFPLSGVGIIHRGKPGSGGFIAPKLISYDFTMHVNFD